MLPRHLNFPLTIIAILVQRASHSSMLCEVRTTDRPSLTILFIISHKKRLALGSIPVVGSSLVDREHADIVIMRYQQIFSAM